MSLAQTHLIDTTSGPAIRIDSSVVSDRLPIFRKPNLYLYTPERAAAIVSVIGEPDVLRQITTLPGVSSGVEGSLGLLSEAGTLATAGLNMKVSLSMGQAICLACFLHSLRT